MLLIFYLNMFMKVPNESEVLAIVAFAPDRLGHVTCLHPELGGTQKQWDALIASKIPVGN